MEEIEQYVLFIKDYCIQHHDNCEECNIEQCCEKYFNREPRKWKLDIINLNIESMLKDLAKRYDIYREDANSDNL